MQDTMKIEAPIQRVWEALSNVDLVASCLPEIQEVETLDHDRYRAVLKAKVAYIAATFDMAITVTSKREPEHMETAMEGKARQGFGLVKANHVVDLKAISENQTELTYKLELFVSGKLASLGLRVIKPVIDRRAESFAQAFLAKCEDLTLA